MPRRRRIRLFCFSSWDCWRRCREVTTSRLKLSWSWFGVTAEAKAAVMPAVCEIDDEPYDEPDQEPRPVDPTQLVHHVAVESDTQNRNGGHKRRAERPGVSRIGLAKHQYPRTHDHECEQGTDVHHLADVVDGRDAPHHSREDTDE